MRYPVLKAADARLYLRELATPMPREVDQYVRYRGEGPDVDLTFIGALREDLATLRSRFPAEIRSRSTHGTEFERKAAELVHARIPGAADVLTDPQFWIWLCVVHFKELVGWRYGATPDKADVKNFGIGSAGENFMYRLWLRGEIGLDETAGDKYHLSRRGDVDFWRSHLYRQGYANARIFARALLKFQYPDAKSNEPTLKTGVIRELVKRLRRARANLVMELLDETMSLTLIRTELAAVPAGAPDNAE